MPLPCGHTPPTLPGEDTGAPDYDPSRCRVCWLYMTDIRYRRLWGGDDNVATPKNSHQSAKPRMSISELAAQKRH